MHVFLTGGTGFIGRRLARVMIDRGWRVSALVRRADSPEAAGLARLGASLAVGDVTDRDSMRAPMRGADGVLHNAGVYEFGVRGAAVGRMRAVNVDGTRNTLELACGLGVPRVVHVSSMVAYGPTGADVADETFVRRGPLATEYERTKAEAHDIAKGLQARGCPIVIVCPAAVVGPGDHSAMGLYMRLYLRRLMTPVAFGDGTRATVHVDDVAEATVRALEKGRAGETYILSGGNIAIRDTFRSFGRAPGALKPRVFLPRPLALAMAWTTEPLLRALGLPMIVSRELADAAFTQWRFTAAKAERELGMTFRPALQALEDTLQAERRERGSTT